MISVTEIILIVAGFAAIIIGYLLPAGKEMDEEDKMLMEREIRELVRREVEDQKDTIDNMVEDSVDSSIDRTERAMERISNEKLSAIGEYSDTVINDIHKNHDEVMFMYDMLNDKHKNLTSVVSEVAKRTDEAKQAVRDAEATVRDASVSASKVQMAAQIATAPKEENVRAILLDESVDKLSGIRIPVSERTKAEIDALTKAPDASEQTRETIKVPSWETRQNANPEGRIGSGYVDGEDIKELNDISAKVITSDEASSLHVIGSPASNNAGKVVQLSDAIRAEARSANPDKNMKELTASDPISQNRQIIEMHKAGKSNMVIARELGLGIGEVKLVIDLSNKHRKVK